MAYSFTSVVIVCIRQGRARPHYTKYTDIDDNAVIAVKKSEIPVLIIIHVKVQRKSQILLLGLSVGGCVAN